MRAAVLPLFLLFAAVLTTRAEREELLALETFDAVWTIVDEQHFDPEKNGVDWEAVREELRPRAEAARDKDELRAVIAEMLGRLGQSHFELIPGEALGDGSLSADASPPGTCGLDLRWMGPQAIVVRVDPSGPAERAGVRPGWALVEVSGAPFEELEEAAAAEHTLRRETALWKELLRHVDGEPGTSVELRFADETGAEHALTLERVTREAIPFDLPGLPTFYLQSRWEIFEHGELSVGLLHFSNWFRPLLDPLDEALVEMRGCDGVVLDLRSNTGGDARVGAMLAGHFFDERVSLGTQRMRGGTVDFAVRPRRSFGGAPVSPWLGPLAILVDETTGSCSEVFAGGMQALGRARVFGSRTAGSALPATLTSLPNGDSLMHAIAEFRTAGGEVLEGSGVNPDEEVLPDRSTWLAGRDVTLAAALAWIEEEAGD